MTSIQTLKNASFGRFPPTMQALKAQENRIKQITTTAPTAGLNEKKERRKNKPSHHLSDGRLFSSRERQKTAMTVATKAGLSFPFCRHALLRKQRDGGGGWLGFGSGSSPCPSQQKPKKKRHRAPILWCGFLLLLACLYYALQLFSKFSEQLLCKQLLSSWSAANVRRQQLFSRRSAAAVPRQLFRRCPVIRSAVQLVMHG